MAGTSGSGNTIVRNLPEGSLTVKHFAAKHSVSQSTVKRLVRKQVLTPSYRQMGKLRVAVFGAECDKQMLAHNNKEIAS
jgi:hypothetical protein